MHYNGLMRLRNDLAQILSVRAEHGSEAIVSSDARIRQGQRELLPLWGVNACPVEFRDRHVQCLKKQTA